MLRLGAGQIAALLATVMIGILNTPAAAQAPIKAGEYEIKAAYLNTFLSYVRWPEELDGPTSSSGGPAICILGHSPFAGAFDVVEGKPWGSTNRPLLIRRLGRFRRTADLSGCHILFISTSEQEQLAEILMELDEEPTLTVADMEEFFERGGMIQLVIRDDHVRWRINLSPIEKAGLVLDPQIINSAVEVGRISAPGEETGNQTLTNETDRQLR